LLQEKLFYESFKEGESIHRQAALKHHQKGMDMVSIRPKNAMRLAVFIFLTLVPVIATLPDAYGAENKAGPPPTPVHAALVQERIVSEQISLIGTTEPIKESTVASEVSGRVETFYVKAGDFVEEKSRLAGLSSTDVKLRLKGAVAVREAIKAKLFLAKKELDRITALKDTNSVAAKQYDEAYFNTSVLTQELLKTDVDIERLEYERFQKDVVAPFAGYIAEEHTQVGEWVNTGGGIVKLVDLSSVLIKADVPEQYVVKISAGSNVTVVIKSLANRSLPAVVAAVLPKGNAAARTFPVHIKLVNTDLKIKSGMEAIVLFNVGEKRKALLVPKDAVVTAGNQKLVYMVNGQTVLPVPIRVLGYYDSDAAIEGGLNPGQQVVIRGNERLRPGQAVQVME
jgi:RND family efflux transporter MFP subunit